MARITVEDCLQQEPNRFALVQLASKRAKQILGGSKPVITDTRGNKAVVTALREIADGKVNFMSAEELEAQKERERTEREAARAASAATVEPGSNGGEAARLRASLFPGLPKLSAVAAAIDDDGDDEGDDIPDDEDDSDDEDEEKDDEGKDKEKSAPAAADED